MTTEKRNSNLEDQYKLRLDKDLKRQIAQSAKENKRSINSEINLRLHNSFEEFSTNGSIEARLHTLSLAIEGLVVKHKSACSDEGFQTLSKKDMQTLKLNNDAFSSNKMISVFHTINKKRQEEGLQVAPLTMFAEAWDFKEKEAEKLQEKIDQLEAQLSKIKQVFGVNE